MTGHTSVAMPHGLTWEEIKKVLLHTAVHGVPAGTPAFRIAQQVRDEEP